MGEVFRETEVVKGMNATMQATIICESTSLIEVKIWVAFQIVERELIDIQFLCRRVFYDQIPFGVEWKIVDFIELIHTDITA